MVRRHRLALRLRALRLVPHRRRHPSHRLAACPLIVSQVKRSLPRLLGAAFLAAASSAHAQAAPTPAAEPSAAAIALARLLAPPSFGVFGRTSEKDAATA